MDIVRLIKISSQVPNTRLAKATGGYLLSLVKKEIEHNSRIAQLSDRVASSPSNHWQRGLMLLKRASQGGDVIHFLEHWEDQGSRSLNFEGSKKELIRLAYENPSLRPIIVGAESAQISQSDMNQAGRQKKKHQNKAPKGKGRGAERKMQKAEGKKSKKQELQMLMTNYKSSESGAERTKITKRLQSLIRGKKRTKQTPKLMKIMVNWNKYSNGLKKVKSPKTNQEVSWATLFSDEETKEFAEKIREDEYIKPLFQLAKKIVQQGGDGSKDDSKKKDEPKKDDKGESDTSKSEGDKGEDKGIVESLMESEGISKEEAQDMAGNILDKGEGGDDEDDTSEAPDSSDSATGQSVSTSGGLGGLGESSGGDSGAKGYTKVKKGTHDTKKNRKKANLNDLDISF
jgi:disulfide oxidoreductase YuzD